MNFKRLKEKLPVYLPSVGIFWSVMLWVDICFAAKFEDKLLEVQKVFTGPGLKTGMAVSTVLGMVFAAAKHSIGMAMMVMGVGIAASYYLAWMLNHDFAAGN